MSPLNTHHHLTGKVAVFIDAANVIHCHRDIGWKVDYKKVKKYFEGRCQLTGIYYYSAYFEESAGQRSFFEMLDRKGYIVRTKKIRKIRDDDGNMRLKGNCDTDIVVDAVASLEQYDTAVLMSGDSDFVSLVNLLKGRGKSVIVISTRGHIAKDLINAAGENAYFDLKKFRETWSFNGNSSGNHKTRLATGLG